ncbi:MAG: ABC transporter ATP-binding protein [Akkermansia sp.]|nr:ABC transporter ATP-binding protein [Akkermansia sp.]
MSSDEQKSFWTLAKPFLRKYLPRYKWGLIFGIISGVIAAAAAGFGLPVIVQAVVPIVFGAVEAPEWLARVSVYCFPNADLEYAIMWMAALFVPFVMSLRGIATYLNTYLLARTGLGMMTDLRTDVFARLQYLPFSFYDKNTRGKLMTTVIQYTQSVQQQLTQILNDLVVQPLTLVAAIAYLVYAAVSNHDAAVLLGNLIITALCIPLVRCVGKRMVKKMRKVMESMNTVTADVEEALAAQREVRSFNLQKHREQILSASITRFSKSIIRMEAWRAAVAPAIEFVSALALAYSLYRSSGNGLTLSQFTAIATAFYFCYDPIKRLGALANGCQVMGVLIDGINEIIEAKDETPEPAHPRPLPVPVTGAVEFRNVIFSYNEEKTVLKDVSVSVPAGQIVALVGPSGSGKTTFINLICRFYDPDSGSVSIDGIDLRDIAREDRTAAIGLVSQFAALFRDTIGENIRVGKPGATDEEVKAAGTAACVTEFADKHPEGYNLMLAEGGGGLSGGQRQRVSIARAILKDAPILILDEATSALDMKSEALIQQALDEMAGNRTTFIIAHRFSTIRMAQRILVFDDGHIVADGSHAQLYENCMLYRSLYDEQVRSAKENGKEARV